MPKLKSLRLLAAACMTAAALPSSLDAQQAGLRLTLRSEKPSYLVAEPVLIRLELSNEGAQTVAVSPELDLETQQTSLFIAAPGGSFQQYDPGYVDEPSRPLRKLAPSQAVEHVQLVLYNSPAKEFAFPTPGAYQVKAVVHGLGRHPDVSSNTIEVRVTAPTGRDDEALRLFRSPDVAQLVLNADEPASAVEKLETLRTQFAGTTYADYAQFYLARRETQEFFSRKPDPQRAIQLFDDLVTRRPDFVLAPQALSQLGKLYSLRGDRAKALSYLQNALSRKPDTRIKELSQRLLEELREVAPPR
jgi:tetratricopeptide (TPR) repeat protein